MRLGIKAKETRVTIDPHHIYEKYVFRSIAFESLI